LCPVGLEKCVSLILGHALGMLPGKAVGVQLS
jgi:hypothetical protein